MQETEQRVGASPAASLARPAAVRAPPRGGGSGSAQPLVHVLRLHVRRMGACHVVSCMTSQPPETVRLPRPDRRSAGGQPACRMPCVEAACLEILAWQPGRRASGGVPS